MSQSREVLVSLGAPLTLLLRVFVAPPPFPKVPSNAQDGNPAKCLGNAKDQLSLALGIPQAPGVETASRDTGGHALCWGPLEPGPRGVVGVEWWSEQ